MEQQGPRGLCEELREKHLSDLCGGSGRMAGSQVCGAAPGSLARLSYLGSLAGCRG